MDDATEATVFQRRTLLKAWINDHFGGTQALFQKATGINQGELSGLLSEKSFGEKRARRVEKMAGMPAYYLDGGKQDAANKDPEDQLRLLQDRIDLLGASLSALLKVTAKYSPVEFSEVIDAMRGIESLGIPGHELLQEALASGRPAAKDAKSSASAPAKRQKP